MTSTRTHDVATIALNASAPAASSARPGILIVDDEPGIRSILSLVLTRAGFQVWLAASAQEALRAAEQFGRFVDIALVDAQLPDASGAALMQELQRQQPSLRCCIMSGRTDEADRINWVRRGAARVLAKPFDVLVLCRELKDLLPHTA